MKTICFLICAIVYFFIMAWLFQGKKFYAWWKVYKNFDKVVYEGVTGYTSYDNTGKTCWHYSVCINDPDIDPIADISLFSDLDFVLYDYIDRKYIVSPTLCPIYAWMIRRKLIGLIPESDNFLKKRKRNLSRIICKIYLQLGCSPEDSVL